MNFKKKEYAPTHRMMTSPVVPAKKLTDAEQKEADEKKKAAAVKRPEIILNFGCFNCGGPR